MKNKYLRRSHISEGKFREIIQLFSADLDATQIAEIAKLNRNTINAILSKIRVRIASLAENESDFKVGEIEIDECDYTLQNLRFCREPITSELKGSKVREVEALLVKQSSLE